MNKTYFISDTHFGHANIIRLANRPFSSVDEMDEHMIESWNGEVSLGSEVNFVGDFSWYTDKAKLLSIFNRLNGHKHFITGNHDENSLFLPWRSVSTEFIGKIGGKLFHLYHYPIAEWNGMHKGAIHIHGHVHDKTVPVKNRVNVSVENINYTPVSVDEVVEIALRGV